MRIPGLKGLRLGARWLRSRFVGQALILGYHRVADVARDTYSLCVTPQHFAEQLQVLHKYTQPISLRQLATGLLEGNLPKRTVAITFDDGYADTLFHAKPLLERYQMPATVFVASGYLNREFWWDELERLLYSPVGLPAQLSLTLNARTSNWTLDSDDNSDPRERLLLSLCDFFRPLLQEERQEGMSQVRSWAGAVPRERWGTRSLRSDELVELAASEVVDIGAHTVTHPILSALSVSEQRAEIEGGKAALEQILGRPVSSFSYPNGSLSSETISLVKETGFDLACTSTNGVAWRGSDRFQLPRFWMQDWEGGAFFRWLTRWLNG